MKKAPVVNLIIIIGLLVLSVMTLIVIYAAAPEPPTVLVFEENFNDIAEAKWKQEIAECKEDDDRFHYSRTDGENGYVEDGILRIRSIPSNESDFPETPGNCSSCVENEKLRVDCVPSSYLANLRTRNLLDARYGRLEVRAKLPTGDWIKSYIGIAPNNTESEEVSEGFNLIETIEGRGNNGSADIRLSFGPIANRTIIESTVTKDQFHVYEIEWKNDRVTFKIDDEDIGEKINKFGETKNSNTTVGANSTAALNQPFYLNVGVDFGGKSFPNGRKRSLSDWNGHKEEDISTDDYVFQVDYIRLFKILN